MAAKRPARIAPGLLDLPDVGTEITQLSGAEGALLKARKIEDSDAIEWSRHGSLPPGTVRLLGRAGPPGHCAQSTPGRPGETPGW